MLLEDPPAAIVLCGYLSFRHYYCSHERPAGSRRREEEEEDEEGQQQQDNKKATRRPVLIVQTANQQQPLLILPNMRAAFCSVNVEARSHNKGVLLRVCGVVGGGRGPYWWGLHGRIGGNPTRRPSSGVGIFTSSVDARPAGQQQQQH